jgi:hypothetical protein
MVKESNGFFKSSKYNVGLTLSELPGAGLGSTVWGEAPRRIIRTQWLLLWSALEHKAMPAAYVMALPDRGLRTKKFYESFSYHFRISAVVTSVRLFIQL